MSRKLSRRNQNQDREGNENARARESAPFYTRAALSRETLVVSDHGVLRFENYTGHKLSLPFQSWGLDLPSMSTRSVTYDRMCVRSIAGSVTVARRLLSRNCGCHLQSRKTGLPAKLLPYLTLRNLPCLFRLPRAIRSTHTHTDASIPQEESGGTLPYTLSG